MRQTVSFIIIVFFLSMQAANAQPRKKYNFNPAWKICTGDVKGAEQPEFKDSDWKQVSLPHAYNEDEAFKMDIKDLTTGIVWYRKKFNIPSTWSRQKVFIEFEGIRQGGEFFINGKSVGMHENGAMAVGFDLTPHIIFGKENVIAVRIDNSWDYREKATNTKFQWSDRNFNANYGGIPKNVYLHVTGKVYQTLPLYSNLQTTGVYIYAGNIAVQARTANIHAESEVRNETAKPATFTYEVVINDIDGKEVSRFTGGETTIAPGQTQTVKASAAISGLNFWSWGYGYLYTVETVLKTKGVEIDRVKTRTGFRKTRFADGMIWLNDRVIQVKGYAQRTSNEWPAVGLSVPAWLSDYSNGLMVESNANLVRWMHITPWKQDIESCDRVGLMQAMPAGDAEHDVADERWNQRVRLMRDAIIYNRNNPSIIFYESGNKGISEPHIAEMKALRDRYDPHGGRAIGSREMLDSRIAEYGGEMLYINKSARIPFWATEYSRDEGLRKYWDNYSYPFHKDGDGPPYKGADASVYNRNQDSHAIENVVRWFDYWRERPGTGRRVSSGGVKIIFSDSNTHFRGEENYRRSGVTDAMRIPKDGFFAHQAMWDGWVDVETSHTHIIGHWNYAPDVVKDIYVVSSGGNSVELFINGESKGFGVQSCEFLHTFKNIAFREGVIKAVTRDNKGNIASCDSISTAGAPESIRLKMIQGAHGFFADGADMVLVEVEVIDGKGQRCPLANDPISFELSGNAEWRGGLAQGPDNYILSKVLPVECGVNRALIRSTVEAGKIKLTATAAGLKPAVLEFSSSPVTQSGGLSETIQGELLPSSLKRGATPESQSYKTTRIPVNIIAATAGANQEMSANSYDDNELTEWRNDGKINTGWITYSLERDASINEVTMKLSGWRNRSYPINIYVGEQLVYSGITPRSLGYVTIPVKEVRGREVTVKLQDNSSESDAFGQITELAETQETDATQRRNANSDFRIIEIEFYENLIR